MSVCAYATRRVPVTSIAHGSGCMHRALALMGRLGVVGCGCFECLYDMAWRAAERVGILSGVCVCVWAGDASCLQHLLRSFGTGIGCRTALPSVVALSTPAPCAKGMLVELVQRMPASL